MTWPEALFGSVTSICVAVMVLALLYSDRDNNN